MFTYSLCIAVAPDETLPIPEDSTDQRRRRRPEVYDIDIVPAERELCAQSEASTRLDRVSLLEGYGHVDVARRGGLAPGLRAKE